MTRKFEYTTLAQRFTATYPVLSYVGTQVNFWIIANLLLVSIMHMTSMMIGKTFNVNVTGSFAAMLPMALVLGVGYGLIVGLTSYYLDQRFLRKLALGKIIAFKTATSMAVLIVLLLLFRYVFSDILISPTLPEGVSIKEDEAWNIIFWLLVIYYSFMTLMISFINQVNKKYGPGVLLPLLMGQYRNPKEETRIFMFMDLRSSTSAAEKLGHLQYSAFIRDCFADINEVLLPFRVQVYQYVGDEIVVTWPEREGLVEHRCIKFYFACREQFQRRANYYLKNYDLLPEFKAGMHLGTVTAVEIGEVKRDIAYHGDTLNTAARIQSVCNEYGRNFLISGYLVNRIGTPEGFQVEALGKVLLKGKADEIELFSVDTEITLNTQHR